MERKMSPWLNRLRAYRSRDPQLARVLVQKHETEMAITDWQRRYRQAPPDQRKTLMAQGRELARQRVDLRLRQVHLQIQWMERRLETLKKRLEQREADKQAAVDRELSEMMTNSPSTQPADHRGTHP